MRTIATLIFFIFVSASHADQWSLASAYDISENELTSSYFIADRDCGAFFRAVQYLKPYVIYRIFGGASCPATRNTIAVLPFPGEKIALGNYINWRHKYIFTGYLDGATENGFPVKIMVFKPES